MSVIKLKTGIEESEALVSTTLLTLKGLWNDKNFGCILVYDLVSLCRDSNYRIFESNKQKLQDIGLISQDGIHDSIKNIVLASFEGEDQNLKMVSPV